MIPISRVVNASLVSSASDPPLSSDSILIKWRPVTAAAGIGSWDNGGNHTIIMTPGGGGVLVSWLVSLLSEEIKGFILQGLSVFSSFLPALPHPGSSGEHASKAKPRVRRKGWEDDIFKHWLIHPS
jgi:hypothetical protein